MPEDDLSTTVTCAQCSATCLLTDLKFPEPDSDSNTQYSWLVGRCPQCGADVPVNPAAMARALENE